MSYWAARHLPSEIGEKIGALEAIPPARCGDAHDGCRLWAAWRNFATFKTASRQPAIVKPMMKHAAMIWLASGYRWLDADIKNDAAWRIICQSSYRYETPTAERWLSARRGGDDTIRRAPMSLAIARSSMMFTTRQASVSCMMIFDFASRFTINSPPLVRANAPTRHLLRIILSTLYFTPTLHNH